MVKKIMIAFITIMVVSTTAIFFAQPKVIASLQIEATKVFNTQSAEKPSTYNETNTEYPVQIQLVANKASLTVGDDVQVKVLALENSKMPTDLQYAVNNTLATIDSDGYLFALSAGEVVVSVVSPSTQANATLTLTIVNAPEVALETEEAVEVDVVVEPKTPVVSTKTTTSTTTVKTTSEKTVVTATKNVESITITNAKSSLNISQSMSLKVTYNPSDASDKDIVWTSSNPSVATVSSSGVVLGKSFGNATITATSKNQPISDQISVSVVSAVSQETASTWELEIIRLTNIEREKAGVGILKFNSILVDGAKIRAQEIIDVFSHTRPDGTRFFTVFGDNFKYRNIGENLASGYSSPSAVMKAWMSSEGHRANILSEKFTDMAVAITRDENGRYRWVQIFYRP